VRLLPARGDTAPCCLLVEMVEAMESLPPHDVEDAKLVDAEAVNELQARRHADGEPAAVR
jgi:hypothetical protein